MSQVSSEKKTKPVQCVVVSDSMNKSRVAVAERLVKHERYGKYIKKSTKYMFHDEENKSKRGDHVLIEMCRPYSARKKFKLKDVVRERGELLD